MDKEEKQELSPQIKKIIDSISELNALEISELVRNLEETFGVSAAPVFAAGAISTSDGEKSDSKESKDSFKVIMKSDGGQKIAIIKVLREIRPDLGLREAKELVDNIPSTIVEDVDQDKAEEVKKTLEEAGAEIELE